MHAVRPTPDMRNQRLRKARRSATQPRRDAQGAMFLFDPARCRKFLQRELERTQSSRNQYNAELRCIAALKSLALGDESTYYSTAVSYLKSKSTSTVPLASSGCSQWPTSS